MKFSKLFLFSFLFLLLVVPLVSTQPSPPPFTGGDISTMDVRVPRLDYFKRNQDYTLHVHAFNDSSFLTNITTTCFAHAYDSFGKHILQNQLEFDSNEQEWSIVVNPNNFSKIGQISLFAFCNNSDQSGFNDYTAIITADGLKENLFSNLYLLTILSFFILFMGLKFKQRILKIFSSIILIVTGMLILFPGYGSISDGTLISLMFGSVNCGLGFYYLIEDSFSKKKQAQYFDQDHYEGEEESDNELEETEKEEDSK